MDKKTKDPRGLDQLPKILVLASRKLRSEPRQGGRSWDFFREK